MVAGPHVLQDLVEEIARDDPGGLAVPQVMMRIADRQLGLERLLDGPGEPVVVLLPRGHPRRAPGQPFRYSNQNPFPSRTTRPKDGDGKCDAHTRTSCSQ